MVFFGHDTENIYNDMYTGTRNAILAKHRLKFITNNIEISVNTTIIM